MSMCDMPLLIKAEMKKENYISLLIEVSNFCLKTYLAKHYLFDGKYFSLDTCEMDDFAIYNEASLIAKYAEPTDACVGLIFSKGCSYSFDDLYFKDGAYYTVANESGNADIADKREIYLRRKQAFLDQFPKPDADFADSDIEKALSVDIKYNTYTCIGIGLDELHAIFESRGVRIKNCDLDMGCVSVQLNNEKDDPCKILSEYFGCDDVVFFCADTDQSFPDTIMILLIKD